MAKMKEKPRGKDRYHHGDLRAALLKAADHLIATRGTGAVSLREVAREAGVSHGAPAHHFDNKSGLMIALARDGWERMIQAILDGIDRDKPANGPDLLECVGSAYVHFAVANPGRFEVMFRRDLYDLSDAGYLASGESSWVFLSDTIKQCIEENFAAPEDNEILSVIAWSMVHGLSTLWISGRLKSRFRDSDITALNKAANRKLTDLMFPKRP
ncbi:TetR/AcrR family transcriptional regulator [Hyphobacterium sp.]|uniref:TetR/AcrR family transcriptional regulator n=1 Tax=Hyphobacterium sp. TaxID=2004662 RepID=UPI003B51A2D2